MNYPVWALWAARRGPQAALLRPGVATVQALSGTGARSLSKHGIVVYLDKELPLPQPSCHAVHEHVVTSRPLFALILSTSKLSTRVIK